MKPKIILPFFLCFLLWRMDAGAQWAPIGSVAFSNSVAPITSVAIGKKDTPYVAFIDQDHNDAVSVMKYNGSSWVYVGAPGFSNTVFQNPQEANLILKIDTTGKPYVMYEDSLVPPFSVMTFNGSNWVFLDSAGLNIIGNDQAYALSMDIAPGGTPYIAFIDGNQSYKATVAEYTNGGWQVLGGARFTPGSADVPCLKIDKTGTPWIAYADGNVSGYLTVQKYNGSTWLLQGVEGFAYPDNYPLSMAFDGNNIPYVAYSDNYNNDNASVKALVSGSWVAVGDTDFSSDAAYYMDIQIASFGAPVVAYSDKANSYKATAQYFNGLNWVNLSTPDFSGGEADWVSLALTNTNVPVVAFSDAADGHQASAYSFGPGVPTAIEEVNNIAKLGVYPNPNQGVFNVNLSTTQPEEIQLSLFDMSGRTIWQCAPVNVSGAYTTTINLGNLEAGAYLLQTKSGTESKIEKIVITN